MKIKFNILLILSSLSVTAFAQNQDFATCNNVKNSIASCQADLTNAQSDLTFYTQQVQILLGQIRATQSASPASRQCQLDLEAASARRDSLQRQLFDRRNGGASAELRSIEDEYLRLERSLPQTHECVSIEEKMATAGYGSSLNLEEARNLSVRNNPRGARDVRSFKGLTYCYKYYDTSRAATQINQLNDRLNRL